MGSFAGHIDEAVLFLVLGLWWMYNAFPGYIKAMWHGDPFFSRMSYPMSGKWKIPVEAILKVLFPVGAFIAELAENGVHFVDEKNNWRGISHLQHMSIFGMFAVHGVIDLLYSLGANLPRGFDRISGAIAFAWFGLSFHYHAQGENKEGVENILHVLPIYIVCMISLTLVVETIRPSWFLAHLLRIYSIIVMATWFCHTSFVLYKPTPFPGSKGNHNWDRHDEANVRVLIAAFGFHLTLALVLVTGAYMLTLFILKVKGQHRPQYYRMMAPLEAEGK